ncbi:hypothetical protein RQ846_18925 [Roseomonas mucosa]|uniref:hypothetical protein n=1 Tax=Roseomonas mucosa TaxID=207340 RepID=UPI0028CE5C82|nr:hypothetical protein [Roseomonas mucosa]MDT8291790.1 hypothetical protein [Roseomonas mucosa]
MQVVESVKPWSGMSTGQFHIDYLGVRTDPEFWKGLNPTRAGRLRVSPPALSDTYFEYAACIMAASAVMRPFRVLEIGAGWGVWSVRAAMVARHLGLPVRTTSVEMMPEQVRQIGRHFMTNGLDPICHRIIAAAVSHDGKDAWMRFNSAVDPGARLIADDWVTRNAVAPLSAMPFGMPLSCRDGTEVVRTQTRRLQDIVEPGTPLDFVHLRIGASPHKLLNDPALSPAHVGLLVLPGINAMDLPPVEQKMAGAGYVKVFGLEPGQLLHGSRGEVKINNALRVYAGERLPRYRVEEMTKHLAAVGAVPA